MKKTLSNLVYQIVFQITKIALPFITIPIVSRALGPEGIGTYNYTNSITQYFVLFAGLGIGIYGNRQIAVNRDSINRVSQIFWELFSLNIVISMLSLTSFFIFISFSSEPTYFYMQSLVIIAAMLDVSWFFKGVEDFKKTSLSSLASQIISFILIVLLVKSPKDLGIYILIQSSNILISQIIMWSFLKEYIKFIRISIKGIIRHLYPALQYFIPNIAIVLYTNLNQTVLGLMDSSKSVGYYTNTLVMISIMVTLITTVDLVLLPKMSNLFSKGKTKEIINILSMSLNIQLFLTIPMMFGVLLIAPNLVPWFFGEEFIMLKKTIPMVSPLVVIIPFGMAIGRQYLIPMNRVKVYNFAVILGALVSIISNLSLIPVLGVYGAIVSTILAELFVTATRTYAFIRETGFKIQYRDVLAYLFSAITMYLVSYQLTRSFPSNVVTTFIQIFIGMAIYMIVTLVLKKNTLYNLWKQRREYL